MSDYLKLPVRFEPFFEKKNLGTCSLEESVIRNLHLLITTALGENRQDPDYGSVVWDYDYHIHMSNDSRREMVLEGLKRQIRQYEKRLTSTTVEVNVKQTEYRINNSLQLRRRLEIIVRGRLVRNNAPFEFQTGFFIGPLLFD